MDFYLYFIKTAGTRRGTRFDCAGAGERYKGGQGLRWGLRREAGVGILPLRAQLEDQRLGSFTVRINHSGSRAVFRFFEFFENTNDNNFPAGFLQNCVSPWQPMEQTFQSRRTTGDFPP